MAAENNKSKNVDGTERAAENASATELPAPYAAASIISLTSPRTFDSTVAPIIKATVFIGLVVFPLILQKVRSVFARQLKRRLFSPFFYFFVISAQKNLRHFEPHKFRRARILRFL